MMGVVTTGPWEDRLLLDYAAVIYPVTDEWRQLAKPHQAGAIALFGDAERPHVLMARPELDPVQREMFAEWCHQHIARFVEHGPEPDGWQLRSDGGWQLYAGAVDLPPL